MTYYKHDASGDESLTSRKMRTIRKKCRAAGDVFVFLREEAARQQKGNLDFCSNDELEYVCSDLLIDLEEWNLALALLAEAGFIAVDGYKVQIANWEGKQSEYLQRKTKKDSVPTVSGECPDNIPTVSGEYTENNVTKSGGCPENVSSPLLSLEILRSPKDEKIEKNSPDRDVAMKMKWRALAGGGLIDPIITVMRKFCDWDADLDSDLKAECPPKDRVAWADILADLRKQLGGKWAEMILAAKAKLEQDQDMKKLGNVSIYYLFNLNKNGELALPRIREWAGTKPPDNGNGKTTEWLKFRDYAATCDACEGGINGYKRNIDGKNESVIRCENCGKLFTSEALRRIAKVI